MNSWIPHDLSLEGKNVDLVPLEEYHFPELIELADDSRI